MATATPTTMLDVALTYAARGWHVFPCHTPTENGCSCRNPDCDDVGKHPRTEHGFKDATTDEATIRRWWGRQFPQANIAIRTGAISGLVVLDIDHRKGGADSLADLERSYAACPETILSITGNGQHALFAHPGVHVKNGVEDFAPGLDIRGDGGYIIAPPSLHANGKRYAWEVLHEPEETPLAPMPDWLLALCQEQATHGQRPRVDASAPIPDHRRNYTLFRLGASMRARGFEEAPILAALLEVNRAQCQPPLTDDEVAKIARSEMRYAAGTLSDNETAVGDEGLLSLFSLLSQNGKNEAEPVFTSEKELLSLFSQNSQPSVVLRPEAFHGVVGEVVRRLSPHTEADPAALLIQCLVYFGVLVGRGPYHLVGATRHYPNLFVTLVGPTGKARKGSAYDYIDTIMKSVDTSWTLDNVVSGCGSGEGLIAAVRDKTIKREPIRVKGKVTGYQDVETDPGVIDKRLLVHEPEFASVLKVAQRDGNILSMTLRQAWDTGNLRNTVKTAPQKATRAHIAVVGHITADELRKLLTTTEASNGFANRFLWMAVQRSKLLPDGGNFSAVDMQEVVAALRTAYRAARDIGQMHRDEQAAQAWRAIYRPLTDDRRGLAGNILARSEPQVLRLSMLYALLDGTATIGVDHLKAALAVWEYAEASVCQVFGATTGNPEADALRQALQWAEKGKMAKSEITKEVFHGHIKAHELNTAIRLLVEEGIVTRVFAPSRGGRRKEFICYGETHVHPLFAHSQNRYIDLIDITIETPCAENEKGCEKSEKSERSPFDGVDTGDSEKQPVCEKSEKSERSPFDGVSTGDALTSPSPDCLPMPPLPVETPMGPTKRYCVRHDFVQEATGKRCTKCQVWFPERFHP
jgi:hypothetical protein